MFYIGRTNRMTVCKRVDFGVFLDGADLGEILLPRRYVPQDCAVGDQLSVFLYADSDDRLVATTERPKVQVGEAAYLKVKQQNDIGTFMDWGLPKDLLLPFNEQAWPMKPGGAAVVYCYLDPHTQRIAATTRFNRHLQEDGRGRLEVGQAVKLLIATRSELGYKAIIDNTYLGLIFHSEVFAGLRFGQRMTGYVKAIREQDGKIDLALAPSNQAVRDRLEEQIMAYLRRHRGICRITDKSPPEVIYRTFEVSKANYKRALGRLYKKRLVQLDSDKVVLLEQTDESP